MKKMKKQISLLLAIISILTMCNFYAQAKEPTSIYKEKHEQINFKHTYFAEENNSLTVNLNNKNFIDRYFGEKEKTEITTILSRYPEMESALLNVINQGEKVCAIAYTEVPILIFDDHTERVKEENEPSLVAKIFSSVFPIAKAAQTQTGETAYEAQQNFAMFTMVSKQTDGTYIASTMVTWEKGSFIGGTKYPASGYDYLLQSVPDSFSRTKHSFTCLYNTSGSPDLTDSAYYGTEGDEYTVTNGGTTYIQIKLKDDPLGLGRLAMGILSTTQNSNSTGTRTVNSYYVHTWKEMSISVSISAHSNKEASLTISPDVVEKSWQVYSYVTFNF